MVHASLLQVIDPKYAPIDIFVKQLQCSPSANSILDDYQDGTVGETVIFAEPEHGMNMFSTQLREVESTKPSDNHSDSSSPATSSTEHHKNTSLEAEHEESAPGTQDQLLVHNTTVSSIRDDNDIGRSSSEFETSSFSVISTDTVHQGNFQNEKCTTLRDDYISEELAHTPWLTRTDAPTTGYISDSNTPAHASVENTMPYLREYVASPSTTIGDYVTESNLFSSSNAKLSEETSPMANTSFVPASNSSYIMSVSVEDSQILAKDDLATNETLFDESSTYLPTSPATPSRMGTSSSGYICQSQLSDSRSDASFHTNH